MPAILHDKYYTHDPMARKCVGDLWRVLGMRPDDLFIEPAAGAGAFCRDLPAERLIAIDIMPEGPGIAIMGLPNSPPISLGTSKDGIAMATARWRDAGTPFHPNRHHPGSWPGMVSLHHLQAGHIPWQRRQPALAETSSAPLDRGPH